MAEIGVRLTGDNASFRTMLGDSAKHASQFTGKLVGETTDGFTKLNKLGNTLATALGLNLQNIAENVARVFTGMSKEEEDAYKKLEQLTTQVADANIKNMRAMLTEEQRYQLTIQERDKLLQRISTTEATTAQQQLALKQDELVLAGKIAEIQAYEAKLAAESAKEFEASMKVRQVAFEKEYQAGLSSLSTTEKISALKESIAMHQALITSGALGEKDAAQANEVLATRKNQLVGEEANLRKEIAELEKKSRLSAEDELKLYELRKKAKMGLTEEERTQLKLLEAQSAEKQNQVLIDQAMDKGIKNLNPEELKRLDALIKQDKKLEDQLAKKLALVGAAVDHAKVEAVVTEELTKQVEAAKRLAGSTGGRVEFKGKKYKLNSEDGQLYQESSWSQGAMQMMGGMRSYNDPVKQAQYEQETIASVEQQISDELAGIESQIEQLRTSGATWARSEIPALQQQANALRNRRNNTRDYLFDPNYSDGMGAGIFATQRALAGGYDDKTASSNFQKENTRLLGEIAKSTTTNDVILAELRKLTQPIRG
jgi:hypothetical protein